MKITKDQEVLPVGEIILTISRKTFLKYKFSEYTFYRIVSKWSEKNLPFYNIHETVFNSRWSFKPKFLGGEGFCKQLFDLSWSVLMINNKECCFYYKEIAKIKINDMIEFTLKMENSEPEQLDPNCIELYPKEDE